MNISWGNQCTYLSWLSYFILFLICIILPVPAINSISGSILLSSNFNFQDLDLFEIFQIAEWILVKALIDGRKRTKTISFSHRKIMSDKEKCFLMITDMNIIVRLNSHYLWHLSNKISNTLWMLLKMWTFFRIWPLASTSSNSSHAFFQVLFPYQI